MTHVLLFFLFFRCVHRLTTTLPLSQCLMRGCSPFSAIINPLSHRQQHDNHYQHGCRVPSQREIEDQGIFIIISLRKYRCGGKKDIYIYIHILKTGFHIVHNNYTTTTHKYLCAFYKIVEYYHYTQRPDVKLISFLCFIYPL